MPKDKTKPLTTDINPDYVSMYYKHQYDRIKKHEDQALNISNIVITISALIITFGLNNRQSFGSILILFLPVVIIIANLFAVFYIRDSASWIKSHRMRAKRILEKYIPELFVLDSEIPGTSPHSKRPVGRRSFQNIIHYLFITLATILLFLFTLEALGLSII